MGINPSTRKNRLFLRLIRGFDHNIDGFARDNGYFSLLFANCPLLDA